MRHDEKLREQEPVEEVFTPAEASSLVYIDVGKYRLIQRDSTTVYIEIIGDGEGGEFKIADLEEFIDDFYKENF